MPSFSQISRERLNTCDPKLQQLFNEVIKHFDIIVLCGHRNEADQTAAFKDHKSDKQWPESKHNKLPSLAVDIAPYPIVWNNKERFYYLAGLVEATAHDLSIPIHWGGDWDKDTDFYDQKLYDLPHFELLT